jgi:hypothetical protein
MANFPNSIFSPRVLVDRIGAIYDAAKTKVFFAKDHNDSLDEIVAIETELGLNPKGVFDSVSERLDNIGGAVDFVDLGDVPASYADQAGKVVAVKSDVSGLEFITPSVGAVDFVDLGDVPASYADQAGKVVAVNADEDALEFIAPPAGGSLYTIPISSANTTTLADSSTYYGGFVSALTFGSNNSNRGFRVPIAGTINKISVDWISTATASTNEDISIYLCKNGGSATLIATVGNTDQLKRFYNLALNFAVAVDDILILKIVTPVWETNPSNVYVTGVAIVE